MPAQSRIVTIQVASDGDGIVNVEEPKLRPNVFQGGAKLRRRLQRSLCERHVDVDVPTAELRRLPLRARDERVATKATT